MTREEALKKVNGYLISYLPSDMSDEIEDICSALEQEPTDAVDRVTIKEYLESFGKDTNVTTTSELSSIRHELLERKDELVSFGQLIKRFDDVDAEYGGSPWTLEQIYANFNILIGIESVESPSHNGVKTEQEPLEVEAANLQKVYNKGFEDCRQAVLDKIRAEIQKLRNCSCSCSDGIIDDVEEIIDKYMAEGSEE